MALDRIRYRNWLAPSPRAGVVQRYIDRPSGFPSSSGSEGGAAVAQAVFLGGPLGGILGKFPGAIGWNGMMLRLLMLLKQAL